MKTELTFNEAIFSAARDLIFQRPMLNAFDPEYVTNCLDMMATEWEHSYNHDVYGAMPWLTLQENENPRYYHSYDIDQHVKKLFNMLIMRYGDWYLPEFDGDFDVNSSYSDPGAVSFLAFFDGFVTTLFERVTETYERYVALANVYTTSKTELLKKRSDSTSYAGSNHRTEAVNTNGDMKHRFDDTPQSAEVDTFAAGAYATEISEDKTTGSTALVGDGTNGFVSNREYEPDSLMEEIRRIQDSYSHLMLEWCRKFEGLFINPANEEVNEYA